jgi:hypothetical protein
MIDLPGLEPRQIADLLAASATVVVAEIDALGDESGWRPIVGEWSANECVGHLIEAEQRGFSGRIRQILDAPPDAPAALIAWDPPAVAEARRDHERSGASLATEFVALRAVSVAQVRALAPDDLERHGIHLEVGPLHVRDCWANGSITIGTTFASCSK